MFFKNDIAIAIYDNAWMAQSLKSEPAKGDFHEAAYAYGMINWPPKMDEQIRSIIKTLGPRTPLIPPRILLTMPENNEVQRIAFKNSAINAGGREVSILMRPMALFLGAEGEVETTRQRMYILWEPGQVEVALITGLRHDSKNLRIDAERKYEGNIPVPNPFSSAALAQIKSYVEEHALDCEKIYLWSPQTLPGYASDFLAEVAPRLEVVPTNALLIGAMKVLRNFSYYLEDAK